jgi:predicted amidohydrolase YtcJ
MTINKCFLAVLTLGCFGGGSLFGDTILLTPSPGGETDSLSIVLDPVNRAIHGTAGSTVGWGFTVNWSASANYISFTGSSLGSVAAGGNESNNSILASYTDFIGAQSAPDGIAMGSGTWTQSFDNNAQTGVGAYQIAPDAPASAQDTGQITFDFDIYNGDPAVNSAAAYIGSYSYYGSSTAFSVTVDAPVTGTPEPGPAWLLLGGLAALALSRFRRGSVVAGTAVAAALLCAATANAQAPDLILRNGHIFTGDSAHPWVEAVSIQGDRILAVGAAQAIAATADKHTRIIDLQGRMAMPGIGDSHDHVGGAPYGVEARTKQPPQADPPLSDLTDAVRDASAKAPAGRWIYASVGVSVIRHPREARKAIDEAGAGHPVILDSWWGHGVILNSQGLARLNIGDSVQDPPGGHFDRDPDGRLTGLAEESAGNAIKLLLSHTYTGIPATVENLRAYAQRQLSEGVTTVQIMGTNETLDDYRQTLVQADTPLRLRLIRFPIPDATGRLNENPGAGEETLTPLVRISGVKWVLDGSPLEELAYLTTDYTDRPGWRGRPNYSREFIDRQLMAALRGKDQLMLHIVGDAMTDEVLDEMEKLAPPEQWRPLRVRVEHGNGFSTPARDERAKKLGIVIAQPRPGQPFRALLDAGIPLAYGSDGGMAPFFMFARMTLPGNPNSLSREQALAILTSGSAFAEFQENRKGRLAPGMLADIAVLSQDVMTAPASALPETRSVLTLVGGKIAYRSAGLAPEGLGAGQ